MTVIQKAIASKTGPGHAVLPDRLLSIAGEQKVNFIPYASHIPVVKGKSSLKKNLISLITEGEKLIHVNGEQIRVTPDHILLLAASNYLYTERFRPNAQVKSIMVFFDDDLLQQIIDQTKSTNTTGAPKQPFVLFPKDDYLHSFIQSISTLTKGDLFTGPLQLAKLSELLIYLYNKYPGALANFQRAAHQRPEEERIKQVMEENLSQSLSISELAFLCHMSLPTFKRKFQQIYAQSPARWLQGRRLAIAADLLKRKGAAPGDVYLQAGYQDHSSFSKAFKSHFGVLPRDYATMSL